MRLDERLGLARLTYQRAVARARTEPTPESWRGLLRAATNLRGTMAELGRVGRLAGSAEVVVEAADGTPAGGEAIAWGGDGGGSPRAAVPAESPGFTDMEREIERARTLMRWSRRLVRESRALRRPTAGSALAWRLRPSPGKASVR